MSFNPSLPAPMPRGATLPGPMPSSMPRGSVMPGPMTPSMPRGTVTGGPMTPFGSLPPAPAKQPKLSWSDNTRDVAPGHWGREEANYLTQIGAMNTIKNDPYAAAGYAAMQNPDGSGLMMSADTGINPDVMGRFVPSTGLLAASPDVSPQRYGTNIAHELGHVGSYSMTGFPHGFGQEEVRQRMVDAAVSPDRFSPSNMDARVYLANPQLRSGMGMAFTPQLPGKMVTDRIPQEQGPQSVKQFHSRIPQSPQGVTLPGPMPPSGIPAPRPYPFSKGVDPHQHPVPPAPWQYRNEPPPAAPHPGTPGSQTAETDPSLWDDPGAYFQKKTGIDPNKIKQVTTETVKQLAEGQKQVADAQANPVKNFFLNMMLGGGTGGGTNPNADPMGRGTQHYIPPSFNPIQQAPQQQAEAIPIDVLTALKAELAAKGATPEELAIIDQLIAEQTARA